MTDRYEYKVPRYQNWIWRLDEPHKSPYTWNPTPHRKRVLRLLDLRGHPQFSMRKKYPQCEKNEVVYKPFRARSKTLINTQSSHPTIIQQPTKPQSTTLPNFTSSPSSLPHKSLKLTISRSIQNLQDAIPIQHHPLLLALASFAWRSQSQNQSLPPSQKWSLVLSDAIAARRTISLSSGARDSASGAMGSVFR